MKGLIMKKTNAGLIMSTLWKKILEDLNLKNKLSILIDIYIHKKFKDIKVKKKNRNSIMNDIMSENMTLKTFLMLLFAVLRVKKVIITVTLTHVDNNETSHSITIKNIDYMNEDLEEDKDK